MLSCLVALAALLCLFLCLCGASRRSRDSHYGLGLRGLSGLLPGSQEAYLPLVGEPLDPAEVDLQVSSELPVGQSGLQRVADAVATAAVESATPRPPSFQPLPELGPQRLWTPTYPGVGPTFTDKKCLFHKPNPRLFATDLDQLKFQRSLTNDVVNVAEPQRARQSLVQFLTHDWRSRKDTYTRASLANDVSRNVCVQMQEEIPSTVNF